MNLLHAVLVGAWVTCQALDITTTRAGLARGAVEANPVLRGRHAYAVKIGVNLGMGVVDWRLRKYKTATRVVVPAVMASAGCLGAGLNWRVQ